MIMFTFNKYLMTFTTLFNQIIDSQFGFIIALKGALKSKYFSKLIIKKCFIAANVFMSNKTNNNNLSSLINKADHFNQLNWQTDLYIIDEKNEFKKKKKSKKLFTIMNKIIFRQAKKPFLLIYNSFNKLINKFSIIYHLGNLEKYYKFNEINSLKYFKSIFTIFSIISDTLKTITTQKRNLTLEKNHWLNNRYKNEIQELEDSSLNKLHKRPITIENGTTRLRSVK